MSDRVAQSITIRGVVQGVGFRPFVFRIAREHGLTGWVRNDAHGVTIHAEGFASSLRDFTRDLTDRAPRAASIDALQVTTGTVHQFESFTIAESEQGSFPTAGISPDLPVCEECVSEMLDPSDRRYRYPYINCANCGPRFSIIKGLPYDRPATTMAGWEMCTDCASEFHDETNRRFHAQPIACPQCGPTCFLKDQAGNLAGGYEAIRIASMKIRSGGIVAIKGIGGFHFACDAGNESAVNSLRERKFRKEQPFAVMVPDIESARRTVRLSADAEELLSSPARPVVLAPALIDLAGVSPDNGELGVLLPYTPIHHLLFAEGAPERIVMTSGNRSSEPIAYLEEDAASRLFGIADVILTGERPIARRVDDSVARIGAAGRCILRRSRGYAPRSAARLDLRQPVLAVGADLKNTVTLVVNGEAIVSQHIGDLSHLASRNAFSEIIDDLLSMHRVDRNDLWVVHDQHPNYYSTSHALDLECARHVSVQHHRAHVASVLAERGAIDERVIGVAFDGTGFGDDGTIWGGEFFAGSIMEGFDRVGHLRQFRIPGGDVAARFPVQAAAGLLQEAGIAHSDLLMNKPFEFPMRYASAVELLDHNVQCFRSTSSGRLFDTVAALLGFVRESTYEGQAAAWLESIARKGKPVVEMEMQFQNGELEFRHAILAVITSRMHSDNPDDISRSFHLCLARGIADAVISLAGANAAATAVLSGGVFQNDLLLSDVLGFLVPAGIRVFTNNIVPPNDGGISLGQAAMTLSVK